MSTRKIYFYIEGSEAQDMFDHVYNADLSCIELGGRTVWITELNDNTPLDVAEYDALVKEAGGTVRGLQRDEILNYLES